MFSDMLLNLWQLYVQLSYMPTTPIYTMLEMFLNVIKADE